MDAEWTRIREIDSKMASLSTHIKKRDALRITT
jgi:hypothetical protein